MIDREEVLEANRVELREGGREGRGRVGRREGGREGGRQGGKEGGGGREGQIHHNYTPQCM